MTKKVQTSSKSAVTSADVAKLAGVSPATVSRVFNRNWKGPLREASRQRVLEAAEQLGYQPNAIAPMLTTGRSNMIAVVLSAKYDYFYAEVFHQIYNALQEYNILAVHFTHEPTDDIDEILAAVSKYRVDGVIITSSVTARGFRAKSEKYDIPVVLYQGYIETMEISAVQSDNYTGCGQVADLFADIGHQKIAYFSSEKSVYGAYTPRQHAFISGLSRNNISDCTVIPSHYKYEEGLLVARDFFRNSGDVDAIFCATNLSALATIDAAREHGYTPGKDISIVGVFSSGFTQMRSYQMTCLYQDLDRLSHDAVHLILEKIANPHTSTRVITRPMEILLGATTLPCSPAFIEKTHARPLVENI